MNAEPKFEPFGFDKARLLELMKREQVDSILLSSPVNVYYTTRYTGLPSSGNPILFSLRNIFPYFVYITSEGKVTLICWGYSTFGVKFGVDEIKGFGNYKDALQVLENFLKNSLETNSTLGIESTCPYFAIQIIESRVQPKRLKVIDDILAKLRLIKSERELELLRKSTEIIEKTLNELYDEIHIGMSRLDLMQIAKYRLFKNGATGISHLTFSFGKANPEVAIGEILEKNALVTLDIGGNYLGYVSDNRRYAFTGEVPQALVEHYNTMVEIVQSVGKMLVPGTSYSDIFQHALDLYDQHHLPGVGYINHVGHNIGLETEEEWLTNDPDLNVRAGMAINIELYSQAPTGQHIGDEETFFIDENGSRQISLLPTEICSIN
jgi:Xaa-Pro aminopeptidase